MEKTILLNPNKLAPKSKPERKVKKKGKLVMRKVLKIKGTHAWVETDKGVFRKETKNIPAELLQNYGGGKKT